MPVQIIAGAQWGDEGKGKIVDLLSENVDFVARYQGGANAGHTVVIDDQEFVLHLIPAGIFHPNVKCVLGNGTVIDPSALIEEIQKLNQRNISVFGRLFISQNAHLIMPYHKLLDTLFEESQSRIGTTGRGIGPAYVDKAMRLGIKVCDLFNKKTFESKLKYNIEEKNKILNKIYNNEELSFNKIAAEYEQFAEFIKPFVTDTSYLLNSALKENKTILAEGAQGTLLDVDHGTYPYVTSSNPTSGGACTGLGIPPTSITSVIGVVKSYTTRVGNGPFPTELNNEIGEKFRSIGLEYGATTGRPRRCGWFDAVSVRYAIMINGIKQIAITKLDVLDNFETINICIGYQLNGKPLNRFPTDIGVLQAVTPIYETVEGWCTPLTKIKSFASLPSKAQKYIQTISELIGAEIIMVSVGPRRDQTIMIS